MYGAFGKKINHRIANTGMTTYIKGRRHERIYARKASTKGIQARKRFQTRLI
jgi:hypothetical protein